MLTPGRRAALAAALRPDVAWSALVAQASRHGVAPIVHGHLHALGADRTPPEALDALAGAARACVALNLRLRDELSRLLAAFSRAGIPALPLKGPVLADLLYPAPLLRTTGDLDVLVPAADAVRAGRALEAIGYARSADAEQGADYHTIYTREAGAVVVELHHALGERHVSGLDAQALWRAATRTSWRGQPAWKMALPDLLLYLAFHAVKDGLASLRALVDITLLVERHRDELPWAALADRATAAHLGPAVYLALGQARGLLGAPVPETFLEAVRPRHPGWGLAQRLFRWRGEVLHAREPLLVGPFMAVLMLLWEDSARARRRHLGRNLLPSPRLRARWTSAPASASWLVWYPAWIAHAVRGLARQLTARSGGGSVLP